MKFARFIFILLYAAGFGLFMPDGYAYVHFRLDRAYGRVGLSLIVTDLSSWQAQSFTPLERISYGTPSK